MKNLFMILILASLVFVAGCQKGITGRAVQDQETNTQSTSIETTTSIYFQYQENQLGCEDGIIRKQTLANGTIVEYCNRKLIERERCDIDASCGRDAECVAGYCRPTT